MKNRNLLVKKIGFIMAFSKKYWFPLFLFILGHFGNFKEKNFFEFIKQKKLKPIIK